MHCGIYSPGHQLIVNQQNQEMEQAKIFIALGGLLILALILASIVRQYQERMAVKRMQIQRVIHGIDRIGDLLQRVAGCPLPVEIEKALREDVLSRYLKVRQIDSRFLGIAALIKEAETALSLVRESHGFEVRDKPHLLKITKALGELIEFLRTGAWLHPLTQEKMHSFTELLGTLRSECVYRFQMAKAKEMREQGQIRAALEHCRVLNSFLNEYGPANSQGQAWYREAEELRKALLDEANGSSAPAA